MSIQGHGGIGPLMQQRRHNSYKSPYGPDYKFQPNYRGIAAGGALKLGITLASFGGVAGIFALFFFSDVPKVRKDIMQKIPYVGGHFKREIPPSDNPF